MSELLDIVAFVRFLWCSCRVFYWTKFSWKLHGNKENWTEMGCVSPRLPLFKSTIALQLTLVNKFCRKTFPEIWQEVEQKIRNAVSRKHWHPWNTLGKQNSGRRVNYFIQTWSKRLWEVKAHILTKIGLQYQSIVVFCKIGKDTLSFSVLLITDQLTVDPYEMMLTDDVRTSVTCKHNNWL